MDDKVSVRVSASEILGRFKAFPGGTLIVFSGRVAFDSSLNSSTSIYMSSCCAVCETSSAVYLPARTSPAPTFFSFTGSSEVILEFEGSDIYALKSCGVCEISVGAHAAPPAGANSRASTSFRARGVGVGRAVGESEGGEVGVGVGHDVGICVGICVAFGDCASVIGLFSYFEREFRRLPFVRDSPRTDVALDFDEECELL